MAESKIGIMGIVHAQLFDEHGNLKWEERKENLITTAGDKYYSQRAANGVAGNTDSPTAADGMKLGTGTTAVAKSGAGAALITYKTASNVSFDSAVTSAVGGDTGWKVRYTATWAPGVATDTALTEAVVTNDSATNATSTAANSYSRVVFTAVNKGVNDTLVINWDHVFYDAP